MKEPSGVIQLWFERKQSFTKEIIPYIRYMMMSGLPVFLSLFGILFVYRYVNLLKDVPPQFPIAWIGAIVLTPLLCYSPLRTFLREADVIYLMPMEHKLSGYLKQSMIRSLRNSTLLLLAVLLVFWPLYRQGEGYIGIWFAVILLVLKAFNAYSGWQERRLIWNNHRFIFRIIRWLLMFGIVLAWLKQDSFSFALTIVYSICAVALLYTCYRMMRKSSFPWGRLIDEEKFTIRRLYSFFNWFSDVQAVPPIVKKRYYLAWLIRLVPYRKASTFVYLHLITFVRTEIGGICIRLVILGGLVNYMVADSLGLQGWGAVLSLLFFSMLVTIQSGTLRSAHRHAIWKDIFPLSVTLQQKQLVHVECLINYILIFILWLPTFPMWGGHAYQLIVMLAIVLVFPLIRAMQLQSALRKAEELD
ncbi:ABC transporter permease [Paenibacillus camelliae]|uniref:ABC transporter permease n=1 Tax=Paenibacillus camelliae TaxID=512410 RepID=UPI00203AFA4E|nr:ABC transporter permease [Paenibacillus camelliae]MCM3632536.1 ABC transporter permease [Paenibacillus camelliae]